MKKVYILFCILVVSLIFTACEDILDANVDSSYTDKWTWSNPTKAEGVLEDAYAGISTQINSYDGNFLDAATDNAVTNQFNSSIYKLGNSAMSGQSAPFAAWGNCYNQISKINMFLKFGLSDKIIYYLDDDKIDAQYRNRLKGEAYFLRAYWSMKLLRVYGGITDDGEALGYPIVTKYISDDKNITADVVRNTYEDCAKQILSDCDTAIYYLPTVYTGSSVVSGVKYEGKPTIKAAYALKSRVATYAASPAYQPKGISQSDIIDKWKRAAQISYDAIVKGHIGDFTALKESDLAGKTLTKTPANFLFRRYYNNNSLESSNLPPDFEGNAITNPSQNLVNAFPDSKGYPITDSRSSYDPQNPYANRDKRMGLVIYHNGDAIQTNGRALEIYKDVDTNELGKDAPNYTFKNTRTGYYLRKWLSKTPEMLKLGNKKNDQHMNPIFRRAEVYYNLIEASNEAVGPTGIVSGKSALELLRDVRHKSAGISNDVYLDEVAGLGKDAFRKLVQNERRIEFAFENQRYFDMRRWLLPLNETVYGVTIEKSTNGLTYHGTDVVKKDFIEVEKRNFGDKKYYYSPIPTNELIKSPKMKNNKGW